MCGEDFEDPSPVVRDAPARELVPDADDAEMVGLRKTTGLRHAKSTAVGRAAVIPHAIGKCEQCRFPGAKDAAKALLAHLRLAKVAVTMPPRYQPIAAFNEDAPGGKLLRHGLCREHRRGRNDEYDETMHGH
jgi:hypothetical protein